MPINLKWNKQSELESAKKRGVLSDGCMKVIEGYFYELLDACDLPEGVEPCLDSGPFRILDSKVDDWTALILTDGGMWFEWCEKIDVGGGEYVFKVGCMEDNDWLVTYWIAAGQNDELDEWIEEHIEL